MIKNVIFDFGNVMARFIPEYMTGKYVKDKEDIRLLSGVIFDRLYWDKLDAGTIEDFEVVEACKERVPERLHGAVEEIYYSWIHNLPPVAGMAELVKKIAEHVETVTSQAYKKAIITGQVAGEIRTDIDPGMAAFFVDNLLMNIQFSYACDYYGERYKIYAGEDIFLKDEFVVENILRFIKSALKLS